MGLGKEQDSIAHASHNMYFFQDPFAGNMADLQSSNTDSVSHSLFIELQLEVPQDCVPNKITVTAKAPLTAEPCAKLM